MKGVRYAEPAWGASQTTCIRRLSAKPRRRWGFR
jgi:hypothetical protein